MKNKLELMLEEIDKYPKLSLSDNIENRLKLTLDRYIEELDNSSQRLRQKNISTVYREINR